MDFPQSPPVTPLFISTITNFSTAFTSQSSIETGNIATMASAGEKKAVYVPMYLPFAYPVRRVFWVNGSAAGGKTDFGIYNADGVRLYSVGSGTEAAGNSEPQFVTPTEFLLAPGRYYFALCNESATTANRWFGFSSTTTSSGRMAGLLQQASAFALPATATFAAWESTSLPIMGITKTASGF